MKKKTVQLTIAKPCHEDWSAMTPNEKGKFCDSCAKPVIDFSKSTDSEIIRLLETYNGQKTCGRFNAKQLERPMVQYQEQKALSQFNLRAVMFGATLTSLLGLESCRNEEQVLMGDVAAVEQTDGKTCKHGAETEVVTMGEVAMTEYDHSNEKRMSGLVQNADSEKLVNAKLALFNDQGEEIGKTFSKTDGSFILDLNWDKKPSYIVVSADNFTNNTIYLKYTEQIQEMKITLLTEMMKQGEVQIDEH